MRRSVWVMGVGLVLALSGAAWAVGDWEPLFASRDGLREEGGAWTGFGGEVGGRVDAGQTGWLVSLRELADVELELEFKTAGAAAGVVVRGHWLPVAPAPEGAKPADLPRRMYGYFAGPGAGAVVVSTDPEPPAPEAAAATTGGWHTLRVRAVGNTIEAKVGGTTTAVGKIQDERYLAGAIALGATAGQGAPGEVFYRNIRVKDLGREGKWRPLFDGASLAGWKTWGEEEWTVQDGVIIGRSGPKKSEGYLATDRTWRDFRVRGQFRMMGEGNFGLFYHSTITLRPEDNFPVIAGLQGEVAPGYPGPTGWVYESYKRGWLEQPAIGSMESFALRPGQWNEIEIRSVGNHVTTWVNGIRVLDLVDQGQQLHEGCFALQLHTGGVDGIQWKDLYVEE